MARKRERLYPCYRKSTLKDRAVGGTRTRNPGQEPASKAGAFTSFATTACGPSRASRSNGQPGEGHSCPRYGGGMTMTMMSKIIGLSSFH